jgi:ferrochelatase
MLAVAEHYYQVGGRSPINEQNRRLVAAIERELAERGPHLPVYWGNRNWRPLLPDALRQMAADGVRRALAFVTSAFSSYSGCRQYREDIARAQQEVGQNAPHVDKLRAFFNHPGFIEPVIEQTRAALDQIPSARRDNAVLIFTAHSIPQTMADGCDYQAQLHEACGLVAAGVAIRDWHLVYQSRSGPSHQRWLEPDVCDFLRQGQASGPASDVILVPVGFISDHMEVVYDLDIEARNQCESLGFNLVRAATVGTHPRFVRMIRELVEERCFDAPRLTVGKLPAAPDTCPDDCCLYEYRTG